MWTDSHAHLCCDELYSQADVLIERARQGGVGQILTIATNPEEVVRGQILQKKYPELILLAGATTPHDVEKEGERDFPFFVKAASALTAIGETGLDYHYAYSPKTLQQQFLRGYVQLAKERGRPLIFHCREAFDDLFAILKDEKYEGKAILHCFTGTLDEAKRVVDRGWFLSLSGIATFKKSVVLQEVAKWVPLTSLLIETDAPYLAPQSRRGQVNEPAYVVETGAFIAGLKGIDSEKLAEQTSANFRALI